MGWRKTCWNSGSKTLTRPAQQAIEERHRWGVKRGGNSEEFVIKSYLVRVTVSKEAIFSVFWSKKNASGELYQIQGNFQFITTGSYLHS